MFKRNILVLSMLFLAMIIISPFSYALIEHGSMKIFAVSGTDSAMDANLEIEIHPGTGQILTNINSLVGNATQESQKNAVNATDKVIGDTKTKYDYVFDIQSGAYSIDGPSAGAAMALLMVSMFKDKNIATEVSMTGTITQDGYVGDVGGIYQKSKRASEIGIKLFMIPLGNREQVVTIDGEVQKIDLIDYAYKEWGMKIVEVQTLSDVLGYVSKDIDEIDINAIPSKTTTVFIPEKLEYSDALNPMRNLVDKYIVDSETKLKEVKDNLNNSSLIKDPSIQESILLVIEGADEAIKNAKIYSGRNYLYSAANNSFVAIANITIANEIISNPSVLSLSSTAFDERLNTLEEKINLTEKRSTLCSLEKMEWCIGARQRLTWAKDKLNSLKTDITKDPLTKISDYSYAISWVEISNDFLDIGITDSKYKFVESSKFKEEAQQKIIDVENKLALSSIEISKDEDLLKRLNSAKINYSRGWYVTSIYDSSTAMGVLISREEGTETVFNNSSFQTKYNKLITELRTVNALNSIDHVWSKMYLDHAIYFYNSYESNLIIDPEKAGSDLKTSNSIVNIAISLFEVEDEIIGYYNSADIQVVISDTNNETIDVINTTNDNIDDNAQKVYIYERGNSSRNNTVLYVILAGLFLIIVIVVIEVEILRRKNSKEFVQKQISHLDEMLLEGRVSAFTYKEMRSKHLEELRLIKEKEFKKNNLKSDLKVKKEHFSVNPKPDGKKAIKKFEAKDKEKSQVKERDQEKTSKQKLSLKKGL